MVFITVTAILWSAVQSNGMDYREFRNSFVIILTMNDERTTERHHRHLRMSGCREHSDDCRDEERTEETAYVRLQSRDEAVCVVPTAILQHSATLSAMLKSSFVETEHVFTVPNTPTKQDGVSALDSGNS